MRFKGLLLFSFLLTVAVAPVFAQYEGGDNDGSSVANACVTTLDGVDQFSFGTLTGSTTFCDFSTEGYSVGLNNPPQDIQFYWTVPPGATILSGANDSAITVAFDNTPGTIEVVVVTGCISQTFSLPVTNGVCTMYQGSDNDGFSAGPSCSTTLNGDPLIVVAPAIVGSPNFCDGATESFSIQVDNAPSNTYYNWTVPAGSTIFSGQGTSVIIVAFGAGAGDVSVDVITDCATVSRTMPVSPQSCPFYAGGDNDGFAEEPSCSTDLNGGPVYSVTGITGSTTFCEFGTEGFAAVTVNAPANTYYDWTVPADATIVSGQGTANITVLFGNTSGDVSVNVITDCGVVTPTPLAVTVTSCSFYAGGDNDGFSNTLRCAINLDGTDALTAGPIVGSTTFCDFSTETYTFALQGANIETTIVWSVPAGATIVSGQGTTTILVAFGNTSGNVEVAVTNQCQSLNPTLAVSTTSCLFYAGGDNDGFSTAQQCASNLDGGPVFVPGAIVGSPASCEFSTESYSIAVAGATVNTTYVWTVPAGATVVSGQGTNTIIVNFGNTNGNVAVTVSNDCASVNVSTPVTVANCIFYAGGNNDGFSHVRACETNLNGGSVFTAGAVTGSSTFCSFSTESYSVTVGGITPSTTFTWSVPPGASIISGQGTNTILVSFGASNGNVAVLIANDCESINTSLPVTGTSCIFYAGGSGDGFAVTTATNIPLPIALVSFDAEVHSGIVYLKWETSSEYENDFFMIERSKDGKTFEPMTKVEGAGTSLTPLKYQAVDSNPYRGTSYYRLSQTDYDGTIAYFRVLIVKVETFGEVTKLYPNPVDKDEMLHVDYFAEEDGQVKISIINPAGISNDSGMVEVKAGVNLFEFTPRFQTAGVHIIVIRAREKATALRLVVL